MQKKKYDVVVIGSGSGTKIAQFSAEKGNKVALIEQGFFGGTCVNRGCLPSKMLTYPADFLNKINEAPNLNIEIHGKAKGDVKQLVTRVNQTTDQIAAKIEKSFKEKENVDVYQGHASFLKDRILEINHTEIKSEKLFLAIGCEPLIPEIPGLKACNFLTATSAIRYKKVPKSITIIGGGYVSVEFGHYYSAMGTEVTIITIRKFLSGIDAEIREEFLRKFSKQHRIIEWADIKKVSNQNGNFIVEYVSGDKTSKLISEELLVAAGVRPDVSELNLKNTSLETNERGFIKVDNYLRTSMENTWAFGDCIGRHMFRHMANFEGDYLKKLFTEEKILPIDYGAVPFGLFTSPPIAQVGKTEQVLINEGKECFTGKATYKASDMGKARRSEFGMLKLVFDKTNHKLLSAHIVGEEASIMIHMLIAFIKMGATLSDLISTLYIHPTLPEIISSAAHDAKRTLAR
jgi:dihydrolipoamide dehydrogenase